MDKSASVLDFCDNSNSFASNESQCGQSRVPGICRARTVIQSCPAIRHSPMSSRVNAAKHCRSSPRSGSIAFRSCVGRWQIWPVPFLRPPPFSTVPSACRCHLVSPLTISMVVSFRPSTSEPFHTDSVRQMRPQKTRSFVDSRCGLASLR